MADKAYAKAIAVVAPSRRLDPAAAEAASAVAAGLGDGAPRLFFHPQCFLADGHFAGDDHARTEAFVEVANDPSFDAVWFARGGYGACRLDDGLEARLGDAACAKTYLGYSDCGYLLARLAAAGVGRVVHGPMPADIARERGEEAVARALRWLVRGDDASLEAEARAAAAEAPLAAFNAPVHAHALAADRAPDLSGCVLMIEEIAEHDYRFDRTMHAIMTRVGRSLAGFALGRVSDTPENDVAFGRTSEEIAQYWCARVGTAYLGRADIGHDADNKIVVLGPPTASG
ncbi:MAG: LD-carboxypeptidase [Parvularculaceae bacterium]